MNKPSPQPAAVRAVVLDVDGTLLSREGRISPRNRAAIAGLTKAGVPVILATGRIPAETVGYYRELGLASPLVCYHGALVLSGPEASRAALLDSALPPELARELVAFIVREHPDAQLLIGLADCYVINRLGQLARHWDMSGPSCPQIGTLPEALQRRVYKICYYCSETPQVDAILSLVATKFGGAVAVQQAHAHLGEFLAAGVSKAEGAAAALRAVGRDWSQAMAIGDFHNDAEMVRRAAVGVAMGNAVAELKAIADHVTADRDDDGVAAAIERFVGRQKD